MYGVDTIFVLHVRGSKARKESIDRQFSEHGMAFNYMLDWDIQDLNEEGIQKYYVKEAPLKQSEISCGMKHIACLEEIVKNKSELNIIFEDDIILGKNFKVVLEKVLVEVAQLDAAFVVSLGNANNMYTKRDVLQKGKYLYQNNQNRAADSFIINLEAAKKRLAWFEKNKTSLPADHMYNQIDKEEDIDIYWCEPTIVENGSQSGKIPSLLQDEKPFARVRWLWRDFRKRYL